MQNFKTLASIWSWAGQFESYLVENPEDRFSRDVAHFLAPVTDTEIPVGYVRKKFLCLWNFLHSQVTCFSSACRPERFWGSRTSNPPAFCSINSRYFAPVISFSRVTMHLLVTILASNGRASMLITELLLPGMKTEKWNTCTYWWLLH